MEACGSRLKVVFTEELLIAVATFGHPLRDLLLRVGRPNTSNYVSVNRESRMTAKP